VHRAADDFILSVGLRTFTSASTHVIRTPSHQQRLQDRMEMHEMETEKRNGIKGNRIKGNRNPVGNRTAVSPHSWGSFSPPFPSPLFLSLPLPFSLLMSLPIPSLPVSSLYFPSPPLPSLHLPLEVGPLLRLGSLGERSSSSSGSGRSSMPNGFW